MLAEYKHLLVPLDFTSKHDAVLSSASEMAKANDASVTLIHVIEPIEPLDDSAIDSFTEQLVREAEKQLTERAHRLRDEGVNVNIENRIGKRAKEIVAFAADEGVDMILLNSHTITPESSDRSISLSYQVALLAPCAVLLLKC
jgi:universal stress protein A